MALAITHSFVSSVTDSTAAADAGEVLPSNWNASHAITGTIDPSIGGRTIQAADTDYYITSSGNDITGNGSIGAPWATAQRAIQYLSGMIDGGGHSAIINIGAGSFGGIACLPMVGMRYISIQGAGYASTSLTAYTAYDNIISAGAAFTILIATGTTWYIDGLTFDVSAGGGRDVPLTLNYPCEVFFGTPPGGPASGGIGFKGYAGFNQYMIHIGNSASLNDQAVDVYLNAYVASDGYMYIDENSTYEMFGKVHIPSGFDYSGGALFIVQANGFVLINSGASFVGTSGAPGYSVNCTSGGLFDTGGVSIPGTGYLVDGASYVIGIERANVVTPSTGDTVSMLIGLADLEINAAATLATLTVNLPPVASVSLLFTSPFPLYATINTVKAITALTVATTDGSSIGFTAPASMAANSGFGFLYDVGAKTWYPWLVGGSGGGGGGSLTVNSTPISGGSAGQLLYDNGGTLEESPIAYSFTSGPPTGDLLISPNAILQIGQTGAAFGPTYLLLQNGFGTNGAQFLNTGLDLIDFIFTPNSNVSSNIRLEHRSGAIVNAANTTGEFQFLINTSGAGVFAFYIGGGASGSLVPFFPPQYTVSALPTPVTGMTAMVTDSTVAIGAGLGLAPLGSGSHTVPVFVNETPAWIIG